MPRRCSEGIPNGYGSVVVTALEPNPVNPSRPEFCLWVVGKEPVARMSFEEMECWANSLLETTRIFREEAQDDSQPASRDHWSVAKRRRPRWQG